MSGCCEGSCCGENGALRRSTVSRRPAAPGKFVLIASPVSGVWTDLVVLVGCRSFAAVRIVCRRTGLGEIVNAVLRVPVKLACFIFFCSYMAMSVRQMLLNPTITCLIILCYNSMTDNGTSSGSGLQRRAYYFYIYYR